MPPFKVHTITTASEQSKTLLENIEKNKGHIPNMYRILAESPMALESYLNLLDLFNCSSFTPDEQKLILLMISQENLSHYCIATHSQEARKSGIDEELINCITDNKTIQNPRLQALRNFIQQVMWKRSHISINVLEKFFAAGFTQQHILEVVVAIALKTLSNYSNNIARTPLDSLQKVVEEL